ncbi:MAG: hypothetical protein R6U26_04320, partial [Candidatus Undinarchaeales archaeon]
NRKGLSTIVATLIIILLVIISVGILWGVLRNVFESGSGEIDLGSLTTDLKITDASVTQSGTTLVRVKMKEGENEIVGVRFIFFDGNDSTSIEKEKSLSKEEEKLFAIASSEVFGVGTGWEISIAPKYLTSSGDEKIGDITDSIILEEESVAQGGNGEEEGSGEEELPEEGSTCVNDTDCEDGLKCESEECVLLCNGIWEQEYYNESIYECDGENVTGCNSVCKCEQGYSPDGSGGCVLNPAVNEGIIGNVWPKDENANEFLSDDLPLNQSGLSGYTNYYVNFVDSTETDCFQIKSATYHENISTSEIELYILAEEPLAEISVGEGYKIWEAENCGE